MEDRIKDIAKTKGFNITRVEDTYVYLECNKGHKIRPTIHNLLYSEVVCRICNGSRFDLQKAKELLGYEGYKLTENIELDKDRYGNEIIKAGKRVSVYCPKGHEQILSLSEFRKGKRCTFCSGTAYNSGYSRSEEIIARVLDYIGITYERQKDIGEEYENLPLDFYLPEFNVVIEYDGGHHVYGRSDTTEEQLKDIQRRDKLRDKYAKDKGLTMIRISHNYGGKGIVHRLSEVMKDYVYIDTKDPYYDSIVREVFNESAKRFGWLTYEVIKHNADTYLNSSLSDSASITGDSQTVIARHFRWVYGMSKKEYIKSTRVAR